MGIALILELVLNSVNVLTILAFSNNKRGTFLCLFNVLEHIP